MKAIKLFCVSVFILGAASLAIPQEAKRIATISEVKGSAEVKSTSGMWTPAKPGMTLTQGDIISTKKNSWVMLNLDGQAQTATVEIKENSQLRLAELLVNKKESTQKTLLDLPLGKILIKAAKLHSEKSSFEVKTPTSVVGVRGTTFAVSVEALE